MRVVALLATYNEERFIWNCLDHLTSQGIEVYLIDNDSTDKTRAIARSFLGCGLIGMEALARQGVVPWKQILYRKEQLARTIDANWFINIDADEIRRPPTHWMDISIKEAVRRVDEQGYNAIRFMEYVFVPTVEEPDHDHGQYLESMRYYYPHSPSVNHQIKGWRRHNSAELAWSAGHRVRFPNIRVFEHAFVMKHYLFLSINHAIQKYVKRRYAPEEVAKGWHKARACLTSEKIDLQSKTDLREFLGDSLLDDRNPVKKHPLFLE